MSRPLKAIGRDSSCRESRRWFPMQYPHCWPSWSRSPHCPSSGCPQTCQSSSSSSSSSFRWSLVALAGARHCVEAALQVNFAKLVAMRAEIGIMRPHVVVQLVFAVRTQGSRGQDHRAALLALVPEAVVWTPTAWHTHCRAAFPLLGKRPPLALTVKCNPPHLSELAHR